MSAISQQYILGPVLINIFISDTVSGVKCSITKFTEHQGVQLEGMDSPEAVGPCKPHELQQGQGPGAAPGLEQSRNRVEDEGIETNPAEKDLGLLVDAKLEMHWQGAPTDQKNSHVLGCIKQSMDNRSREVILPLYSTFLRAHLE